MIIQNQTSLYPNIVTDFERDFASMIGVTHAATMSNGTSGLEAAFFALGVGPGDEVIAPSYTIHSTFSPVLILGATVRFADINPDTLTIDPEEVERLVTERTKAIVVVHIWGNPVNMDGIMDISKRYYLKVIEDCSHCHGARWGDKVLGSIGDIGVFSLQQSKPVSAGEGGIVVTQSADLLDRMLAYGHQGRRVSGTLREEIQTNFFPGTGTGRKCRAHPIGIALARVDLDTLSVYNKLHSEAWKFVSQVLSRSSVLKVQTPQPGGTMAGYCFGAAVNLVHPGFTPEEVIKILHSCGLMVKRRMHKPNHHWPHIYDRHYRDTHLLGEIVEPEPIPYLPYTERALTHVMFFPLQQFARRSNRNRLNKAVTKLQSEAESRHNREYSEENSNVSAEQQQSDSVVSKSFQSTGTSTGRSQ